MANSSSNPLTGGCVPPFLDAAMFPSTGGAVANRFCATIDALPGSPVCCLPCPITDWTYPDSFDTYSTGAQWLNVAGIVLAGFILLSYLVLPVNKTRSHYLSICLVVSVIVLEMGFTLPLSTDPEVCYNEITPNDMYSLTECAWSGSFIIAGGLAAASWIFIRALSMYLQIVWDIIPGKKFFYFSQLAGWGIPAALFAITITITGVSFRFGTSCHVNHHASFVDFWIPLLVLAGAAGILQLMTFGYCINVYLKNLWVDNGGQSTSTSNSASFATSTRARAVWQRLRKVLWLQWRGISIVTVILVEVIFFSIVFVHLDQLQASAVRDWHQVAPWLYCLAEHPHDKTVCLPLLEGWIVNQGTVMAVLYLLSAAGIQAFLLLGRPAIFPAWIEFFRGLFRGKKEFVSLDSTRSNEPSPSDHIAAGATTITTITSPADHHHGGRNSTTFEMQTKQPRAVILDFGAAEKLLSSPALSSPDDIYHSPLHHTTRSPLSSPPIHDNAAAETGLLPGLTRTTTTTPTTAILSTPTPTMQQPDSYFPRSTRPPSANADRRYHVPGGSFSSPRAPLSRQGSSSAAAVTPSGDLTSGRGGLGFNPPTPASVSARSFEYLPSQNFERR